MNMRKELGFGRRLKPIQGQYNIVRVVSDVRFLHVRFPVGNGVDAGTDVAASPNFPNVVSISLGRADYHFAHRKILSSTRRLSWGERYLRGHVIGGMSSNHGEPMLAL